MNLSNVNFICFILMWGYQEHLWHASTHFLLFICFFFFLVHHHVIAMKVKSLFFSVLIGIITMSIVLSFLHLLKKTQFTMQQFSKPHKFVWINRVGKSKCKNIIVKNECKQWALLLRMHTKWTSQLNKGEVF
jgi:hypothetical protein